MFTGFVTANYIQISVVITNSSIPRLIARNQVFLIVYLRAEQKSSRHKKRVFETRKSNAKTRFLKSECITP